jgi:hypothetical protein
MTFTPPPQRDNLLWIAVDFDGTLAKSNWTPENPTSAPGEPIWDNVTKLEAAVFLHNRKVWIHTARPSSDYELIEAWLKHWEIPFDGIVTGKLLARWYIDDRGKHSSAKEWH